MEPGTTVHVARSAQRNYLVKLFRGDVPLFISYWLFGILIGNVGVAVVELEFGTHRAAMVGSTFGRWFEVGFSFLVLVYIVFILIAIWRSAGKYRGSALWKVLARISVGLGAFYLVVSLGVGFALGLRTGRAAAVKREVIALNQDLPKMIDAGTRLERIRLVGWDLHYDCTMVKYFVADLDTPKFSSVMSKTLKKRLCAKKAVRTLLHDGRKMVYEYRDKASQPLATIAIQESDCLPAP